MSDASHACHFASNDPHATCPVCGMEQKAAMDQARVKCKAYDQSVYADAHRKLDEVLARLDKIEKYTYANYEPFPLAALKWSIWFAVWAAAIKSMLF